MSNSEICVPDTALADTAESGETLGPDSGDEIEVVLRGPVTRREGGNTYFQATSANGQPLPAGELSMEEEDEQMAAGLNHALPGGSMALLVLLLACWLPLAHGADVEFARQTVCTETLVSNYVANVTGRQVFSIEIDNYTGTTHYLCIFDSATNQLNGSTAFKVTPVPVLTGSMAWKEWGAAGSPFQRGVNVCLSTTPRSLTNSSSGGIVTVVSSPRK